MDWYDPSDRSRPIISPTSIVRDYLRKRGVESSLEIGECLLMSLTGGLDVEAVRRDYTVRERPLPLPAFLAKYPIHAVEGLPVISVVHKACTAPAAVDAS